MIDRRHNAYAGAATVENLDMVTMSSLQPAGVVDRPRQRKREEYGYGATESNMERQRSLGKESGQIHSIFLTIFDIVVLEITAMCDIFRTVSDIHETAHLCQETFGIG